MKRKNEEVDNDGETFDLQTLMRQSAKIDSNIADQEHEQGRREAIQNYGLIDPEQSKASKSAKVDTKQIDKLNAEIESLREQLDKVNETNKTLVQANDDYQKALEARDAQIASLGEELDKALSAKSTPSIPNAPKPSADKAETELNPFAKG